MSTASQQTLRNSWKVKVLQPSSLHHTLVSILRQIQSIPSPIIYLRLILSAFAKFRIATISFFMSVLSHRMERLSFQWADFHEILYLGIF